MMCVYKEYLSRPLLNVKYEITPEVIRVNSESTGFINHIKAERLKQFDILDIYSAIIAKCREKKVKIHYNQKIKKSVVDNWELYMETYKEYLSRPLLNVKYEITPEVIRVNSESTGFINHIKAERLKQSDILDIYSAIIAKCREKKVKIHYNQKIKKSVIDNWDLYMETYREYDADYNRLLKMATQIQKRGIHSGCSDDQYLTQAEQLSSKLGSYFWGGQVIGYMRSTYTKLQTLDRELEMSNDYNKIIDIYL